MKTHSTSKLRFYEVTELIVPVSEIYRDPWLLWGNHRLGSPHQPCKHTQCWYYFDARTPTFTGQKPALLDGHTAWHTPQFLLRDYMNISACQLANGSFGFPAKVNRHNIVHKHGFTGSETQTQLVEIHGIDTIIRPWCQ